LAHWADKLDAADEAAQFLHRSLRSLLLYATIVASVIVVLNLLGLLNPLERIMSFPIFQLGETNVTLWTIATAVLILVGFIFASRLLQAYLDYKVYPSLGIDPGLGYALNTFFKYTSLLIGLLVSLNVVGIDLRFLLVFAGAIGIGIGLGLQNMAANVISGFIIIFGGKIRKGDWIEVGGTLGVVTDIYLRATKVRTRDNIEYLIPNSDLISSTIINYSLSSPMIRIELPVGVSYGSEPNMVREILLDIAKNEPLVSRYRDPIVRFMAYGDSSLDFHLLFWIDVREVPRREVRSALYFAVFDAFKAAGIEIPFPQRDIHIRSNPFAPQS
jgi:small-conductance mechanosensitive channel